ncbi:MAG: integration host factor subunit alpha [Alphaproteobacteria bacterium]|nr:integration host factor subunit alpha [Alphaproteobacteria bacterium]
MEQKTLTRADITEAIYKELGFSNVESANLLSQVLEEVSVALENGENVKISSFGTFSLRQKNERIGRNPKTKVEVPITPRRVVSFRPSLKLRKAVNKP